MKILLTTDGSSYAREAARFLNNLLHHEVAAQVDVVAVRPTVGSDDEVARRRARGFHPAAGSVTGPSAPADWLSEARRELTNPLLSIEEIELSGDPARLVVERAAAVRYDLIVAGAKGCGATPFFELGSVARSLLQNSSASTLLVRKGGGGYARELNSGASGSRRTRVLIAAAQPTSEAPPERDGPEWPLLASFALDPQEIPVVSTLPGSSYQPREVDRRARRDETDLLVIDGRVGKETGGIPDGAARTTAWTAPCSVLLLRTPRRRRPTATAPVRRSVPRRPTPQVRQAGDLQS